MLLHIEGSTDKEYKSWIGAAQELLRVPGHQRRLQLSILAVAA